MMQKFQRLAFIGLLALILVSMLTVLAASNTVPATHLDSQSFAITVEDLKPPECAGITLVAIVACPGGNCDGTDANELILGSAADDDIKAGKGNDCILGGGGSDTLRGDQDTDVCVGGPGGDSFHPSCETQIQ